MLLESGVTWLPAFLWRISKFWRGVRAEVPWVDRSPADIVRDHVRLTIVPFDAPPDAEVVERIVEHLRSDDILLYASDYPHWQFDGDDALPPGLPPGLKQKILVENPLSTYVRLQEDVVMRPGGLVSAAARITHRLQFVTEGRVWVTALRRLSHPTRN